MVRSIAWNDNGRWVYSQETKGEGRIRCRYARSFTCFQVQSVCVPCLTGACVSWPFSLASFPFGFMP